MSQVIDYRSTYWGHNVMIKQGPDGLLRGHVIHRTRVAVGDKLVWSAPYGTATGRVTEVNWLSDPEDMYGVTVEVILRESDTGEVLWPLDEEQP